MGGLGLAEVDPADAFEWTQGRALLATGSPFPPCKTSDGKTYVVAQTNNALIYPALGLGAIVSKSRTLSPGMVSAFYSLHRRLSFFVVLMEGEVVVFNSHSSRPVSKPLPRSRPL